MLINKRVVMFGLTFVLIWVVIQINHLIFKKLKAHNNSLHLLFFERLISVIVVIGGTIMAFSMLGGFETVWKTMLGGTAILSAVLIFAAQDIAKDILGGLMITLYKPFEIGNRVELEDGTEVGVVTTGYHSISLEKSICFALVKKEFSALDTPLYVHIRKKVFPGKVVKKRFYQTNYKK